MNKVAARDRDLEKVRPLFLRHLGHLGAESLSAVARVIVQSVLDEIQRRGSSQRPVRLAQVADAFGLDPVPVFEDSSWTEAMLEYDRAASVFRIRFRRQSDHPASTFNSQEVLTHRARFQYAHELAHVFFFSRKIPGVRAQDLVAQDLEASGESSQLVEVARRYLARFEEERCNTVARRVLLPAEELARFVSRYTKDGMFTSFARVVEEASQEFQVPRSTALLAIGDGMKQTQSKLGRIAFPANTLCLYVGSQVVHSRNGPTIAEPEIQLRVGNGVPGLREKAVPFLWRRSPSVLGDAVRELCVAGLSERAPRRAAVPLAIPTKDRRHRYWLDGYWEPLGSGSSQAATYRYGLLWGVLTPLN